MPDAGARRTINKSWHDAHRMPRTAKLDDRVAWHLEHARECGCRDLPPSIAAELERRGQPWQPASDAPRPPRQTAIPVDAQHSGRPPHMNPSRPG